MPPATAAAAAAAAAARVREGKGGAPLLPLCAAVADEAHEPGHWWGMVGDGERGRGFSV